MFFLMSFSSHSYAICMRFVCHLYVLVYNPYVTRMYSYAIHMSTVCGFTMNRSERRLLRWPVKVANLTYQTNSRSPRKQYVNMQTASHFDKK